VDAGVAPPASPPACTCPQELKFAASGAVSGTFGISDYWPGVTSYWGADKTLGKFDTTTGGWHTVGHKFQVVGRFSRTGPGGAAPTFRQMARLTTVEGGAAGEWFDDMNYVDASGDEHHWDPNAEAGTTGGAGYPGVRRSIATDKVAYTDPPGLPYQRGSTNTYRKLDFKITFTSPSGCSCGKPSLEKTATQEIKVKRGVPRVLQFP
jgi:hypothetical protein